MTAATTPLRTTPLARRVAGALATGDGLEALTDAEPAGERDALLTLLAIHDLHVAPIERLGDTVRFQHHPAIAALKWRLDAWLVERLDAADAAVDWDLAGDAVAALRAIGRIGLVPEVYTWLAEEATEDEIRTFLTLEGGPDGGFDDLVAACQVGLDGEAKLELARNYWDEMGNGTLDRVHTELHRKLSRAVGLRPVPRDEQPTEALLRSALGSVLATNRHLQPEMVGALGLIELQAGPRCRKVVAALERVGAGDDALDFYQEHAVADPRHGKDWVDNVVATLGDDPRWAAGMVRGARWRSLVNARFFARLAADLVPAAAAVAS